jgi:hypothetical protein
MATVSSVPQQGERTKVELMRRVTREKRTLWYQLSVLQQPQRARACGAGLKGKQTLYSFRKAHFCMRHVRADT